MKIMKKFSWLGFLVSALSACSSSGMLTPTKLAHNIAEVPQSAVISVVAINDFPIAHNAQSIVKLGKFKSLDNVYDSEGNKILIPRDAIVTGLYTNDGVTCDIAWKAVYLNEAEFKSERGALVLDTVAAKSICDPLHGVSSGERVTLRFQKEFNEE